MKFGCRLKLLSIVTLLAAATPLIAAEVLGWELRRDREGIQVYARPVAGSPYAAVHTV